MLNLRDIRPGYFDIGPPLVDPLFHPLQYLPGNLFIRADGNESECSHCGIILPVNLGACNIEAVSRPSEDALDDAAFFFEGMRRQGEMDFKTEDEHF